MFYPHFVGDACSIAIHPDKTDGCGYAGAPLYGYAGYGAPATAGTTIVIVTPGAPAYTAPPVVGSGYYNYAPGYWGGYGRAGYWGGYGRAGYWGGYGYGWR
jgi:hypothetical protein